MTSPGRLITFEGIDGSGKSTQARRLHATLLAEGEAAILTREPGGSPGAEEIRRLLVEGAPERWSPEAETLLFTAARRDHMDRVIGPALEAGRTVISDRFVDSTRVYQGTRQAGLRRLVDDLHALMIGREADLTLVIDLDPAVAVTRSAAGKAGEERFEGFGPEFQRALRQGFLDLAGEFPARCRVVDGSRPSVEIAAEIAALVRA